MARDKAADAQKRKFLGWVPVSRMSDESEESDDGD